MKRCAQNPMHPEYTLCGDAFDAPETEGIEPFTFAVPGEAVTCDKCCKAIAYIYEIYTPKGKVR